LGLINRGSGQQIFISAGSRTKVFTSLGKGDGILILGEQTGQTHRGALEGPVSIQGGWVEFKLATPLNFNPAQGSLWLLSRHDGKLPVKKGGKAWRHPLPFKVQLTVNQTPTENHRAILTLSTTELGGLSYTHELPAEPSKGDTSLEASIRQILTASDCPFEPSTFDFQLDKPFTFIQPRLLKDWRRNWYKLVEERAKTFIKGVGKELQLKALELPDYSVHLTNKAPVRALLSPLKGVNRLIGFITEWENLMVEQLAPTPWGLALPLAPFTPNEESYFNRLRDFLLHSLSLEKAPEFFLGLNNPCHITWVKRLRDLGLPLKSWFCDWGFHCANPWTAEQLAQALPGMAFAVHWLEDTNRSDQSYFPPLFTSRACMLRNSFRDTPALTPTKGADFDARLWSQAKQAGQATSRPVQGPHCPNGCAGHFSARLVQGKTSFRVEARDCINYLILEEPKA
jgi:hypothetical protein